MNYYRVSISDDNGSLTDFVMQAVSEGQARFVIERAYPGCTYTIEWVANG